MGLIRIIDSDQYRPLAILKQVESVNCYEEINGENKLDFTAVYEEKAAAYVNENNLIELDDDYFDVIRYVKKQNEDGTLTVDVEAEHVSYRLNESEYDLETFAFTGSPISGLAQILDGTPFAAGTVEFIGSVTYSAQEAKSRRQILMEFVAVLGGEVDFSQFTVSIVQHRGSTLPRLLAKGKNIKVVSKTLNRREKDAAGNPLVSYSCEPIQLPNDPLGLGDEVKLIQSDLGFQENLRIVSLGYNPYDPIEASIELANFVSSLEDQIYRIETKTVAKEKVYNGCKIGPEEGFVSERSDGKAKAVMNATEGISIYGDSGSGLERNFYVNTGGRIQARELDIAGNATFEGDISASTITGSEINGGAITGSTITAKDVLKVKGTGDTAIQLGYEGSDPGYVGNAPGSISFDQHTTAGAGFNEMEIDVGDGSLSIVATQGVEVSRDMTVGRNLTVNGALDASGAVNTLLRNGCYIEAAGSGLRLHFDANNYFYIGDGVAYVVVDGNFIDLTA